MSDLSEIITRVESQRTIALAKGHFQDVIERIKTIIDLLLIGLSKSVSKIQSKMSKGSMTALE